MPLAATGILAEPIDALASLIAASATFRSWVGAATEAAAKERVYRYMIAGYPPNSFQRPYALIIPPVGFRLFSDTGAFARGDLLVEFEADVSSIYEDDHISAGNEFCNKVGAILEEMMNESGNGGRLIIGEVEINTPPVRAAHKEVDDFFYCSFRIGFGLDR